MALVISVIVCTRNRAASLARTLEAFQQVAIPSGSKVEIITVDNASTDNTSDIIHHTRLPHMALRYVFEGQLGQSYARNKGLSSAQGEIILFTDDDVVPARDWMPRLVEPLLRGHCHGVAGGVQLAQHLHRPWMNQTHKNWLAAQSPSSEEASQMVGANMGFHRCVLQQVPGFDAELGPGALGFGDDTLFSMQMIKAGFRLRSVYDARVIHHPDPSRLQRAAWLRAASLHGKTSAYILHHWRHEAIRQPWTQYAYLGCKLVLRRLLQPPPPPEGEGCPAWELSYVTDMARCRQFILESKRPRNYALHGVSKIPPAIPTDYE